MLVRSVLAVRPPSLQQRVLRILRAQGILVEPARDAVELWRILNQEPADIVFVSSPVLSRPPEIAIEGILALPDAPLLVVVRAEDDPETRARLLGAGCDAVVTPRMSDEAIADILTGLTTKRRELTARLGARAPSAAPSRLGSFHSRSPAMHRVLEVARRAIAADTSVLILGETGVGKEHLARAIHEQGPRGRHPFVPVNCGAIPESLIESELFGHERGAFTGAHRAHRGQFELAHGGTIFLDEIGETPAHVQVKLLRVLQDRTIQRVGGETPIPVDVRLLAATNRDLERDVREHRFRPDLFYRIGVVTLTIPPLRDRREDIPELVQSYLEFFTSRLPTRVTTIEESCLRALVQYDWPGNIRELINVIERAVLICDGERLTAQDLPDSVRGVPATARIVATASPPPRSGRGWEGPTLREARRRVVDDFERDYLTAVLEATGGRVGAAAKRAGISPRALFEKMRRHRLRKEDFKD